MGSNPWRRFPQNRSWGWNFTGWVKVTRPYSFAIMNSHLKEIPPRGTLSDRSEPIEKPANWADFLSPPYGMICDK